MKKFKLVSIGVLVLALLPALVLALPAVASPAQQGTNLLQNPSFEGTYVPWNAIPQIQVPDGWTPWWIDGPGDPTWMDQRPEWKPAEAEKYPNRVHSGTRAIQWHKSYATYFAGAYQQVNVPANAPLKFSAYTQAWSCSDYSKCSDATSVWSYEPAYTNMQIGIDPTGGTNPLSPNVVWSGGTNPLDNWVYVEVSATAQGSLVTVFLSSHPDWPKQNQDGYFDDASLVVVGASAPAPAPATTTDTSTTSTDAVTDAAVAAFVTATPSADGSVIHTVKAGETEWMIAANYGITLDELRANNVIGAFIYEGQQLLISKGNPVEPTAEPTAEPTLEPTPTEAPAESSGGGEPVATEVAAVPEEAVTTASLCVTAFNDLNANGARDAGENLLPGVLITVFASQQPLGSYTTDGTSEPYCFSGLADGNYEVAQQVDAGWQPTTLAAWGVALKAGDVFNVDFGNIAAPAASQEQGAAVADGQTAADTAATEESTWARVRTPLFTGLGIFGLLLVVGAVVYIALSRRKF